MVRKLVVVLAACLLFSAAAFGVDQTVKLRNGGELTGEVTKTASGYEVRVKTNNGSAVMTVAKEQVLSITDVVDPLQEYKDRLAKINPDSFDDHLALAEWANSKGMLTIAKTELQRALELKKDDLKATLLLRQVEANLTRKPVETNPGTTVVTPAVKPPVGLEGLEKLMVSDQDINRIRLAELRKDDTSVSIEFKNKLIDRFVTRMQGRAGFETQTDRDRFQNLPRVQQAIAIRDEFERGDDRSWTDDILIKTDPQFMGEFRGRIWPAISQACASANCHASEQAPGGLRLFGGSRLDKAYYTNYIILDSFSSARGKLIDRDHYDDSLLLQFGLPADQGKVQHPAKIPAAFTGRDAANYKVMEEWLRGLRSPTHPDYHLQYKVPGPATTMPASAPARAVAPARPSGN